MINYYKKNKPIPSCVPLIDSNFSHLEFQPHDNFSDVVQARLDFDNGFSISVIASKEARQGIYGSLEEDLYEVAIYDENGMIPLSRSDDVVGWQTAYQVSILMKKAQLEGSVWVDELKEDKAEFRKELGLDY